MPAMDSQELREQAKRWRDRAPGEDKETAEAIDAAANSLETIAKEKDAAAPKPAPAAPKGEFIHRAYDGPAGGPKKK
jgi:hypothetical protein